MRTKERNQFNCYMRESYSARLKQLADGEPAGEFIEKLVDLYEMDDLMPTIIRLTEKASEHGLPDEFYHQLYLLHKRVGALLNANPSASPNC